MKHRQNYFSYSSPDFFFPSKLVNTIIIVTFPESNAIAQLAFDDRITFPPRQLLEIHCIASSYNYVEVKPAVYIDLWCFIGLADVSLEVVTH